MAKMVPESDEFVWGWVHVSSSYFNLNRVHLGESSEPAQDTTVVGLHADLAYDPRGMGVWIKTSGNYRNLADNSVSEQDGYFLVPWSYVLGIHFLESQNLKQLESGNSKEKLGFSTVKP